MKLNRTIKEAEDFVRRIGWEKWRDPYGSDAQESEWPGAWGTFDTDDLLKNMDITGGVDGDEYSDNDIEEATEELERQQRVQQRKVKVSIMTTPMGIIPITEHTSAGHIFNFWTAHTNFRMTPEIIEAIDNTDGIESFDLFTPYRWRIAIGKAFSSAGVKDRVMKNLRAHPIQKEE